MTLRDRFASLVSDALIELALWLVKGTELPPVPVLPETWEQLSAVQPTWREPPRPLTTTAEQFQLRSRLAVADRWLGWALRWKPDLETKQ